MFVLLLTMEMRNYRLETCCIILVFLALNAGAVFESIEMVAETANQQDAQVHVQHLQEQRHQEQQKEDDRKDDGKTCGSGSFATHGASNSSESRQLDKNNGQGQCMDVVKEECDTLVAKYDGSREKACIEFFSYMQTSCRKTCLLCENVDKNEHQVSNIYSEQPQNVETRSQDDIMDLVAKVDDYMYNQVYNQDDPNHKVWQKVKYDCKNQNANCIKWAKMGECDNNPSFMKKSCGPSCFTCDLLDIDTRCPFDRHAPQTYSKSGELDAMFTRMVTQADLQQKYTVTILSQPAPPTTTTTMVEDCGGNDNDVDVTNSKPQGGPWVVLLDDFLTEEECDTLIALGTKQGYERSQEFNGGLKPDGSMESYVSKGRTSSQTWCMEACCLEHNVTKSVHNRIQDLLQIPPENYEHLQLLKYEKGQFYHPHYDYILYHRERFPGVRILTVFLYLNNVEEGGGTNFPNLGLTVEPKRGRALVWPSVLNEDPNERDDRTKHAAMPVLAGEKYGANTWIHQRNFKESFKKRCM